MLGFSDGEITSLFHYFDYDNSGLVEYDEFLRTIRGPMNANRKKIVKQAFDKIDKDKGGFVDINDIRGTYDASKHPDVLQGKKTEEQILQEFLETFETAHNMRNNTAPDHIVTYDEFCEYYNNISASIDNDEYFALMMANAWKINEGDRTYSKGWSSKDADSKKANPINGQRPSTGAKSRGGQGNAGANVTNDPPMDLNDKQLLQRFRDALAKRGGRGIAGLQRQFKIADDDHSMSLSQEEFVKALHDFRAGLNEP